MPQHIPNSLYTTLIHLLNAQSLIFLLVLTHEQDQAFAVVKLVLAVAPLLPLIRDDSSILYLVASDLQHGSRLKHRTNPLLKLLLKQMTQTRKLSE